MKEKCKTEREKAKGQTGNSNRGQVGQMLDNSVRDRMKERRIKNLAWSKRPCGEGGRRTNLDGQG